MIRRERLTGQNRVGEEREGKIRLHATILRLANAVHWIDGCSDWCGFRCLIASSQPCIGHIGAYTSQPSARNILP